MKLKNILSIICFLFVVASCSVEDDTIMNDVTNNIENEITGSAYVSVGVRSGQSATKATEGNASKPSDYGYSHPISNCYLLLLDDADNILYRAFKDYGDEPVSSVPASDFKILVKVGSVTKAIAVINASVDFRDKIKVCITLDDLKDKRELDAFSVLAIGDGKIDWRNIEGSESTMNSVPVVEVSSIVAENRVANVELSKFNIKYFDCDEDSYKVKLENFWLTGMKSSVGLYSEGEDAIKNENLGDGKISDNDFDNLRNIEEQYSKEISNEFILEKFNLKQEQATFRYVFPNTNGTEKITAHLRFSVTTAHGTKYYEREYIVNRPSGDGFINNSGTAYVNPGYWYQLNVTVHVKKDFIDCAFTCSTKDWIYNEINVDL
ncbi:hypothetical protein [uncultured Parabacteroides sp.]|uniref:hypothetical protein n=1 Tax=uncultured Parabacteroides sp. TaxID=512312 RepID=UPI00258A98EC|nr:hypothetical protein [uncultured Parabacteroides sp.]